MFCLHCLLVLTEPLSSWRVGGVVAEVVAGSVPGATAMEAAVSKPTAERGMGARTDIWEAVAAATGGAACSGHRSATCSMPDTCTPW